jgi:hypothetical protein
MREAAAGTVELGQQLGIELGEQLGEQLGKHSGKELEPQSLLRLLRQPEQLDQQPFEDSYALELMLSQEAL